MNQKQQELYEKLLKKVNEFCLGYAAEDVIAAIDALVDTYETPKLVPVTEPLLALQNIKLRLMRSYDGSIGKNGNVMFEKEIPVIETALKEYETLRIDRIEEVLKALEIIKKQVVPLINFDTFKTSSKETKYRVYDNELYTYRNLTEEEYELLKEILDNGK